MTYTTYSKQSGNLATSLALSGLLVAVVGLLFATRSVVSPTRDSIQTRAQVQDVQTVSNRDIGFKVDSLVRSRQWDYILSGNVCFTFRPPTSGRYSIEVYDGNSLIGASAKDIITTPSEAVCGKRGLGFAVPFNLRDENACPALSIRVRGEGNWPAFQEEVARIASTAFCSSLQLPSATPPPPTPTRPTISSPTSAPATPTPTRGAIRINPTSITLPTRAQTPLPTPTITPENSPEITGRISIYTCTLPTNVHITYCSSENSNNCATLPYRFESTSHGVWQDDTGTDRAFIYRYRITKKADGTALESGDSVYIKEAFAVVNSKIVISTQRDRKTVAVGQTYDLTVDAHLDSCSCTFAATNFIKDQNDTFLTLYDNKLPLYGIANDKQRGRRGEGPVSAFQNGIFAFGPVELNDFSHPESYGRDHLASIKLYHDNAQIIKQVCTSTGEVPACPGETWSWEKQASQVRDPKVIDGLRVTCGAQLLYGWVINPNVLQFAGFTVNVADLDLNKDGIINTIDYQMVLDEYGTSPTSSVADINKDKVVNALDLSFIIARIGEEIR